MRYSPTPGLGPRRLHSEAGIALGPILFIIAVLAIIAGAIAAGAGGFTANTNTESANAMAEVCAPQAHGLFSSVHPSLSGGEIVFPQTTGPSKHAVHNMRPCGGKRPSIHKASA
jgi:hypothetical protein